MASALHHADAGRAPVLWFARFCGVIDAILPGESKGSNECDCTPEQATCQQGEHQRQLQHRHATRAAMAATEAASMQQLQQQPQVCTAEASKGIQDNMASHCQSADGPVTQLQTAEGNHRVEQLLSSSAAFDFYLFCCCQLAYPNSVLALFPEAEECLPLVKSPLVMESLKAVFR